MRVTVITAGLYVVVMTLLLLWYVDKCTHAAVNAAVVSKEAELAEVRDLLKATQHRRDTLIAQNTALTQEFDRWKEKQRKFEETYKEWEARFEEERKLCIGPPRRDHALLLPSADGKRWQELPSLVEGN